MARGMATQVEVEVDTQKNFDVMYKILVIGDSSVGKTALLTRFCEGRFQSSFMATVGIDYKTKIISLDDENIKLQIWDTAGQERFRTLTNAYFRGAAGAILMYDITNRNTFTSVAGWMDSVSEHASPNITMLLIGHKADLEDERNVGTQEGQKLAEHYECLFFEASAKTGTNCSKIFTRLAQEIKTTQERACYAKQKTASALTYDGQLHFPDSSKRSNCCL